MVRNRYFFLPKGPKAETELPVVILHFSFQLLKPRVLSPLRSLRTCVRNEVDLVALACEDAAIQSQSLFQDGVAMFNLSVYRKQ